MDQLKQKLAVAARHGFWISTVVVTFGALAVWYLATGRLSEENAERTSALQSDVQSVSQVRSALPTHPNDKSHERMEELIDRRQDQVLDAWTSVFERQQAILKWPDLGRGFVEEFEDLIPIERYVDYPPTPEQQKVTELLNRYAQYIGTTLPEIAEIAKTKWEAEFTQQRGAVYGGGAGAGTRRRRSTGEQPLVKWSKESQQKVQGDLFPWLGDRPSTLEVYYSQENIWILKQLLQIIANVNGDATQPFQARIHEIQKIGIGSSVEFDSGELAKPGDKKQASGGEDYGMEGGEDYGDMDMDMDMDYGSGGMDGEMGGGQAPTVDPDPADNRYVDMQNQPIPAETLRSALQSNRPEDATIAVAKRVPVMMRLRMHQRHIHELLAECGSVPLMVEVRRVRVLPQSDSRGGGMTGGDAAGDEDMYGGGGEDMYGGGGEDMYGGGGEDMYGAEPGGGFGGADLGSQEKKAEFPLDVDIEVYGLIYIYNPPDPEKLGLEQVTEETVIDGSATPSGPQPTTDAPVDQAAPADDPAPVDETATDPAAAADDDAGTADDDAGTADNDAGTADGGDPETLPEPGPATSEDDGDASVEPGADQAPADDDPAAPDDTPAAVDPEPAP